MKHFSIHEFEVPCW